MVSAQLQNHATRILSTVEQIFVTKTEFALIVPLIRLISVMKIVLVKKMVTSFALWMSARKTLIVEQLQWLTIILRIFIAYMVNAKTKPVRIILVAQKLIIATNLKDIAHFVTILKKATNANLDTHVNQMEFAFKMNVLRRMKVRIVHKRTWQNTA